MKPKDFAITCFISILLNCSMKGCGSSLKCCFEILKNHSVSYNLSEPPGALCTPTWSEMEFVVVDEHGNVDKTKVVYLEPQKLILKGNIGEVKQVTYRTDCPHTGRAYTAECHDPCVADELRTTQASNTTQKTARDLGNMYTIVGIITIITIIITTVICLQRNKCQALRCIWKAVPKNETPIVQEVTDASRISINDND